MVTPETVEFMRRQVAAYDRLPPAVRRAIADAPHPVDPEGVLLAVSPFLSPARYRKALLAEVERRVAYMSAHVAAMYEELRR